MNRIQTELLTAINGSQYEVIKYSEHYRTDLSKATDDTFSILEKHCLDFCDTILSDFEMSKLDNGELCWVLAGTDQKYTTKEVFKIYMD